MKKLLTLTLLLLSTQAPSTAQPAQGQMVAPYDRLNLSEQQAQQIQQLDSRWNNRYTQLQPRMNDMQQKLNGLLIQAKPDAIEITTTQQNINHIREQLGTDATSTYLRKRSLLSPDQRQQLDSWMRRQFTSRLGKHI